ncbi:MAG: type II secretion system F family protein [Armatimonadetes bacterium]|nr:type II secretion system F family protein [Armatimonadota bacterium]
MPTYVYTGRNQQGKTVSGLVRAKDPIEVRDSLRQKSVFLTTITEQAGERSTAAAAAPLFGRKKVKLGDMVIMSRQLATLVRAGLPIVQSLNAISEQVENATLATVLKTVCAEVQGGLTLAEAMRKHPKIFPQTFTTLVMAGENSGTLEETLEAAAVQLDNSAELREKLAAALTYPVIVVISALLVVCFMLIFIVPAFSKVYDQLKMPLPAITMLLVTISNVIVHNTIMMLLVIGTTVTLIRRYVQTIQGKRRLHALLLKLPLLGKLLRKIALARFSMTFGGAIKAGVPLLQALTVAGETTGNVILQEAIVKVAEAVNQGSTLHVPIEQTKQFPAMMTSMIAAGEQSGNLDEMLEEINRFYKRDIEYSVNKLTRMMEPLMTIVVGGLVLFILLALYMPVFSLSNAIHK